MLIPVNVQNELMFIDNAPMEIQKKIQRGCSCCGWAGDRALALRQIPTSNGAAEFVIFHVLPGQKPTPIITAPFCDHRLITALLESKKQYEDRQYVLDAIAAEDARYEKEIDERDTAMQVELVQRVAHALDKDGQL